MLTDYHAKYFANELTRQADIGGVERLTMALFDANVDLNPHQIEAALFAMRSPVSEGVILADEVGLGKTIEASLVICQLWAERKRKLLVICPASIRKQWASELTDKFNLPTTVLDSKTYREAKKSGISNPFDCGKVVVCSLNFAAKMNEEVRLNGWNLIVIDEAHKLRNAHQPSNKSGQKIRFAVEGSRKILLTATPLQNSLMELYGMTTVISDYIFGEASAFRDAYCNKNGQLEDLQRRLKTFCRRTLRKDVLEYVQYTSRIAITRTFRPTDNEHEFYEAISSFLQRTDTYSVPTRQRVLLTQLLRKILASSPYAVAGTLSKFVARLKDIQANRPTGDLLSKIIAGEDLDDDDFIEEAEESEEEEKPAEKEVPVDQERLRAELQELEKYVAWANSIGVDTKSRTLLDALRLGFEKMNELGAAKKALIFTESRRTQEYVKNFLEANGFAGKLVVFNGSNNDEEAKRITANWAEANQGSGKVTGSRDIDARAAIIDYFENTAEIMIATEAAAEGVNLQFCSLVVNYDLPWNPQRIEQRIGRCHRYGQKFDVVVINFVNERNEADRRTFELLAEKFQLFDGVFGASDEVLGSIESGVDFQRKIAEIYQNCRTTEEIESSFLRLRAEMEASINARMIQTRQLLMEFFDEEIHHRLRLQLVGAQQHLNRFSELFWSVTHAILRDRAQFDDKNLTLNLLQPPMPTLHVGTYHLISKSKVNTEGEFLYRMSHPLGQFVLEAAKAKDTPLAELTFDLSGHEKRVTVLEELKGQSGWLILEKLVIESFGHEEVLLFSGLTDAGKSIDQEVLEKLFSCDGQVGPAPNVTVPSQLSLEANQAQAAALHRSETSNNLVMNEEQERLENWADDMIQSAESDLKETRAAIKEASRESRRAATTEEQLHAQGKIRDLEQKLRRQRQKSFDVEDEIKEKRDKLIDALEKRMRRKSHVEPLFTVRWRVE